MNTPRPRLLFLAYPFPPSPAIGAVRTWGMAKHLARMGWSVTLVTPDPAGRVEPAAVEDAARQCEREGIARIFAGKLELRAAEAAQQLASRHGERIRWFLMRRIYRFLGMGLDERWWRICLEACAGSRPGDFDLVLATGSPFRSFLAARRLALRLGIPYVLDYRDPWSLGVHVPSWQRALARPLERRVLRDAAASLTVSPSLAQVQGRTFSAFPPPLVVSNGYDPEGLQGIQPTSVPGFAVVYTGNFYTGQREIDPVVQAVKQAAERMPKGAPRIRLHYYGTGDAHVRDAARRHGAGDLVECHGRVSRAEALSAVRGAGMVVVITSMKERTTGVENGIVTGKLFEPLGMGVPILLVAPKGSDAAAIVEESGAGRSFCATEIGEMAQWLASCAGRTSGYRYEPPPAYSWPVLAQRLDEYLLPIAADRRREGKIAKSMEPGRP
jgi:glycosyltransferase involved in cell wall biosynthesis